MPVKSKKQPTMVGLSTRQMKRKPIGSDHLIDIKTGEIIEFVDDEIEKLQKKVADKYGYELVDHKLELYGIKKNKWTKKFLLKHLAVKWMSMTVIEY